METQVERPVTANLPRQTCEARVVVDYGNAADITERISS